LGEVIGAIDSKEEQCPDFSVVIPAYGSPDSLSELALRLADVFANMNASYEVIFIDDGCPLESWPKIAQIVNLYPQARGIRFTRNFGQHMAILAGLAHSQGNLVVVMDCDLQDRPEEIPAMFRALKDDDWYVVAHRSNRSDPFVKRLGSWGFHRLLSFITGTKSNEGLANFGVYRRGVIDAYLNLEERTRAFQLHLGWLGYRHSLISVEHSERPHGSSSYGLINLTRYAFDLIFCFSDKPIRIAIKAGFITAVSSMLVALFFVMRWLTLGSTVEGWTSLVVSIWFLGGLNMMLVGVVGLYVSSTFDECKKRPLYVIDKDI
jgi:dolichol-phosphate mannosyltransferase